MKLQISDYGQESMSEHANFTQEKNLKNESRNSQGRIKKYLEILLMRRKVLKL